MQFSPKVSVIIPAYNAEKYIGKAVRSILGQTWRNLEITVVDDGSTDATAEIVRALAAEDSRLRLLSISNGGPANARNAGLDAVKGSSEFIMFSDADDEILPDTVEKAVSRIMADSADLLLFGFTIVNPDGTKNSYSEPDALYTPETIGESLASLYKANLLNQVWSKLFRTSLIEDNGIRFQDFRWGEDRLFIFDCLEKATAVSVLSYCGYLYMMHTGSSLITGFYDKKATVCALSDIRAQELCQRFGVKDDSCFRYMFCKSIFSCMVNMFTKSCSLSNSQKRAYVRYIVENDYIQERCSGLKSGFAIRFISLIMRTRNVSLNMFASRMASLAGRAAPKLFQLIKHKK